MPLTKKGEEVKSAFINEYGKKKGTSIFYAYEHKHPEFVKGLGYGMKRKETHFSNTLTRNKSPLGWEMGKVTKRRK